MGIFHSNNNKIDLLDKLYQYEPELVMNYIINPIFKELKIYIKNKLQEKRGAFIFYNNSNILTFLYKKMSEEELKRALPISYNSSKSQFDSCKDKLECYITVFFDENGRDYIGKSSKETIDNTIIRLEIYQLSNLLDETYEEIKIKIPNLDSDFYNNQKTFAIEQLKIK